MLIGPRTSFERRIMHGVARRARELGWELLSDAWSDISATGMQSGEFSGAIARIDRPELKQSLAEVGLPVVNVGRDLGPQLFPRISCDDVAIGRMAAEHLLERNFWQFGLLSSGDRRSARERQRGFLARLGELASRAHCLATPLDWSGQYNRERLRVEEWLAQMPRPFGLFVVNDILARRVLQMAQSLGLRVPEDCAVVGVGDFELQNELAPIPLTTVVLPGNEIGRRAVDLLQRMIDGSEPRAEPERIAPIGIIHRRSSDTSAVADEQLAGVLAYLRAHLGEGLKVSQLAAGVNASRRWVEGKFREHLGRSPREVILQYQMHRARQILVETDWPLELVARRCGLSSAQVLSRVFHREQGVPPSVYRRRFREQDE